MTTSDPMTTLGRLACAAVELQRQFDAAYLEELVRWDDQRERHRDTALAGLIDALAPLHTQVSTFEVECGFAAAVSRDASVEVGLQAIGRMISGYEAARAGVDRSACKLRLSVEVSALPARGTPYDKAHAHE